VQSANEIASLKRQVDELQKQLVLDVPSLPLRNVYRDH
jgi:hypothetical protein